MELPSECMGEESQLGTSTTQFSFIYMLEYHNADKCGGVSCH